MIAFLKREDTRKDEELSELKQQVKLSPYLTSLCLGTVKLDPLINEPDGPHFSLSAFGVSSLIFGSLPPGSCGGSLKVLCSRLHYSRCVSTPVPQVKEVRQDARREREGLIGQHSEQVTALEGLLG